MQIKTNINTTSDAVRVLKRMRKLTNASSLVNTVCSFYNYHGELVAMYDVDSKELNIV